MAEVEFDFEKLKDAYENFRHPLVIVKVNGKDLAKDKQLLSISDIEVELTSGFEAAIASFWIFDCYDSITSVFEFEGIKKYVFMGSPVLIEMGYGMCVREVFRGFISQVNFSFQEGEIPGVKVTAMDVKGIMMSGSYARQLAVTCYSDAVSQILSQTAYERLKSNEVITKLNIADTPDKKPPGANASDMTTDKTIEMVDESDYEFVVRAAKKFNYEFFTVGGTVYFRKAKDNAALLMELGPQTGMHSFDVEYNISGLVGKIEVRGLDVGKAKQISAVKKMGNKISKGNKAKPLVTNTKKVYIDPTVSSKQEAGYRADYLAEDISYRLATLEAELIGIPELIPGRFIRISALSSAVSDMFYLVKVRQIMDGSKGYITKITGKAASMENTENGIF